jgi:hypothetical protein
VCDTHRHGTDQPAEAMSTPGNDGWSAAPFAVTDSSADAIPFKVRDGPVTGMSVDGYRSIVGVWV